MYQFTNLRRGMDQSMLGEKIRSARKQKGITLSQLAIQVGVTSGYLSQMENNKIDPSLNVLRKLSICLKTPIADFLEDGTQTAVVIPQSRVFSAGSENGAGFELLTPMTSRDNAYPGFEVTRITIPGGKWVNETASCYKMDCCIYVLQGSVDFLDGEKNVRLNRDDSMYIKCGTVHRFYNPDELEAVLLCAIPR